MGIRKQHPAAIKHHAIFGKVKSSKFRRPKVSIVQMAGKAKTKLTRPNPKEERRVSRVFDPASLNIVDE